MSIFSFKNGETWSGGKCKKCKCDKGLYTCEDLVCEKNLQCPTVGACLFHLFKFSNSEKQTRKTRKTNETVNSPKAKSREIPSDLLEI